VSDPYETWDSALANGKASDEPDGWPDLAMIPLVEWLRAAGIVTLQSCSGHPGTDDGHLWIDATTVPDAAVDGLDWSPFTAVALHLHPRRFWEFVWLPEDRARATASLWLLPRFIKMLSGAEFR
jgi:hypothetical protein